MIRLSNVTKRYADVTAIDDLSMDVAQGEIAVLLGPSGCGKTTTLRAINRMVDVDAGRILVDDKDITSVAPSQLRRHIGYVIQSIGLFPHMTIARNVAAVPKLLGWDSARIDARVNEVLELVGLDPAVQGPKRPSQLSGGQQQRVGVARALAADPAVLLMDEPFGALDPISRQRLQEEFLKLQRELRKTVLFVTHDVREAVVLGDRVALMDSGRLVQYDAPEALWLTPTSPFVTEFFGAEFPLNILSRHTLADVPTEPGETSGLARVSVAESLKDALAHMVSSGKPALAVVNSADEVVGRVTFAAVVSTMTEGR